MSLAMILSRCQYCLEQYLLVCTVVPPVGIYRGSKDIMGKLRPLLDPICEYMKDSLTNIWMQSQNRFTQECRKIYFGNTSATVLSQDASNLLRSFLEISKKFL